MARRAAAASPGNDPTFSNKQAEQIWAILSQTGNWEHVKFDLDGNELAARDTNDNGTDDFTLTYDGVGSLTDDGEHYEYVWDVFGRLVWRNRPQHLRGDQCALHRDERPGRHPDQRAHD